MILLWLSMHAVADDARSYLDQARYFVKKEWYGDALEQLVKAVGQDEGDADPEAWFLLAQVRYQLCDLPGAREAADTAVTRAIDEDQRRQTREFATFLRERFGLVQMTSRRATTRGISLELDSTLYDPDLKRYVTRLADQLNVDSIELPTVVGLPVGSYFLNGALVHVDAGTTATFDPNRPTGGAPVAWLEIGAGAQGWVFQNGGPLLDLSLPIPLDSRVTIAPVVIYHPTLDEWVALSGGMRLGVGIGDRVRVTPSLIARYGTLGFVAGTELALSRHNRTKHGAVGVVGRIAADLAIDEGVMVPGARATLGLVVAL